LTWPSREQDHLAVTVCSRCCGNICIPSLFCAKHFGAARILNWRVKRRDHVFLLFLHSPKLTFQPTESPKLAFDHRTTSAKADFHRGFSS
jgi:hypothetical protein